MNDSGRLCRLRPRRSVFDLLSRPLRLLTHPVGVFTRHHFFWTTPWWRALPSHAAKRRADWRRPSAAPASPPSCPRVVWHAAAADTCYHGGSDGECIQPAGTLPFFGGRHPVHIHSVVGAKERAWNVDCHMRGIVFSRVQPYELESRPVAVHLPAAAWELIGPVSNVRFVLSAHRRGFQLPHTTLRLNCRGLRLFCRSPSPPRPCLFSFPLCCPSSLPIPGCLLYLEHFPSAGEPQVRAPTPPAARLPPATAARQ